MKRYDPAVMGEGYNFGDAEPCMVECEDGDYVKWEEVEQRLVTLRDDLRVFGQHKIWCAMVVPTYQNRHPCNCGLEAAIGKEFS